MSDLPIDELLRRADKVIEAGGTIFFKFTCENCGARQGFEEANTVFLKGECEECGHVTEIKKGGFMAVFGVSGKVE